MAIEHAGGIGGQRVRVGCGRVTRERVKALALDGGVGIMPRHWQMGIIWVFGVRWYGFCWIGVRSWVECLSHCQLGSKG